jgi:starch phosphorylase
MLGDLVPEHVDLPSWNSHGTLHMTELGGYFSRSMNGVSQLHGQVAQSQFPMFQIGAITNGIDHTFWVGPRMRELYDRYLPGWESDPSALERIDEVPDQALLAAHAGQKKALFAYVEKTTGRRLDPGVLTLGFARRVVPYKRATLLFQDLDRLRSFAGGKIQLVYAGKAHPTDERSKGIIRTLYRCSTELAGSIEIVFLENYRMEIGAMMTGGVDVWLNNPLRPNEASGTSGMKAILNGVPNLSTLDGWWVEGCRHGQNGWTFGDPGLPSDYGDALALYDVLQHQVLPAYYGDQADWARIGRGAIKTASHFTSQGMVERYADAFYGLRQEA